MSSSYFLVAGSLQVDDKVPDLLHLLPVDGVASDVRQVGELHV